MNDFHKIPVFPIIWPAAKAGAVPMQSCYSLVNSNNCYSGDAHKRILSQFICTRKL